MATALAGATLGLAPVAGPAPAASAASPRATAARSGQAPRARIDRKHRRPGCGSFCRQAGGFGAGPGPAPPPNVIIPRQTARITSSGTVFLRMRCVKPGGCRGAILLSGSDPPGDLGRSDLRLKRGKARRVEVALSSAGAAYVRARGRARRVFATADLVKGPISTSEPLTLLAPRRRARSRAAPAAREASAGAPAGREARSKRRRPGCGTFCRQAGGFGAGGGNYKPKVTVVIPRQRARVTSQRTVLLRMRCLRRAGCRGAVLLTGPVAAPELGRSDLRLAFGRARRVEVDVSAPGLAYLRRHRRVRGVYAIAVVVGVADPSASKPLTLLAPRRG